MSGRLAPARVADTERTEVRYETLQHMLAAVERAWYSHDPFPHFLVEGIFPDDIYHQLLALLPGANLYDAVSYDRHAEGGVSNRGKFSLTDASLVQLDSRQRSFWLGVRDALGSPAFKRAVFARLSPGLAYRFGVSRGAAADWPAYPLPELLRETTGYRIRPHLDTRRKLVTMQIALPVDHHQGNLGTEFYRRSANPLSLLREPRGFNIVKQAPFLPNVCYAFCVLNTLRLKSWHGRTRLKTDSSVRNTILNIWYARPEHANADLVEQYYATAARDANWGRADSKPSPRAGNW